MGFFHKLSNAHVNFLTARHFDRDPDTNEMLWFSAPPLNFPRAPSAKHSLAYLHFLTMKRKQQEEAHEREGSTAIHSDDQSAGLDMLTNKRLKTEPEVKPTTREMMQKLWVEMKMDT